MSDLYPDLRAALEREGRIHAWQIRRARTRELQTYINRAEVAAQRLVELSQIDLSVFVRHDDLQGGASMRLLPVDAGRIQEVLDQAIYMAQLGGDPPYELPEAAAVPAVPLHDPALAPEQVEATARGFVERWEAACGALPASARPASAEIFCVEEELELVNSRGLALSTRQTQATLLGILLGRDGDREAERMAWVEERRAADLDLGAIVARAAEEARDLARADLPPSGSMPVVVDSLELSSLFSPLVQEASAESIYRRQSRLEIGRKIPMEGSGGDPITVASNAVVPFGVLSYAFDADGVAGQRAEIVREGVFRHPWSTKQFADYTGHRATGAFAALELAPGGTTLDELLRDGGPVLQILSFSWLTPDLATGDFSTEIRLAYLHEKGSRRPIKGGTVSGNLYANLGSARLAAETLRRSDYIGPTGVRLEGCRVEGA